jgi:hypothetical protein
MSLYHQDTFKKKVSKIFTNDKQLQNERKNNF